MIRKLLLGCSGALAGVLLAAPLAAQERRQSLDDPTIVAIFDAANTWDIETGDLAASKARASEVRDLSKQFARDHRAVRQQGRDLAGNLGVTPTPPEDFPLAAVHEKAMKRLRSLSGPAFDRAYLEHEVAFHRAVIDAVKTTLLPAIRNAELKALVERVAPAFEGHRAAAQRLLERTTAQR